MTECKPCPFCGEKELCFNRYSIRICFANGNPKDAYTAIKSEPNGDYYEISCSECGGSLMEHQDGLFDAYETYLNKLPESEREKFWQTHEDGIGDDELWEALRCKWNERH